MLLPNAWDAGSARIFEQLGFDALATTGAGISFTKGQADQSLCLDEMLAQLSSICKATALPVTADMQNGFGPSPEQVAKAVLLAAEVGCSGCSIEDDSGVDGARIYPFALSIERVLAGVEAARSLTRPFVFTARCDNFFAGVHDLEDTLKRLEAYEACGANVLFAPGLTKKAEVEVIASKLKTPLNVLVPGGLEEFDLAWLAEIGVARVSVGGFLARTAYGAAKQALSELRGHGQFQSSKALAISSRELNGLFSARPGMH